MSICFFIGHREAGEELLSVLTEAVERHIIEYGVTEFVVGQYGNFDRLSAKVVKAAKKRHPTVTLTLLLPYHPYDRPMPVPEGFDRTYYPPGMETVPKRAAIVRANRYMVDNSTHLIAYVWHPGSNAKNLLEYAQTRERNGMIHIENLTAPDGDIFAKS